MFVKAYSERDDAGAEKVWFVDLDGTIYNSGWGDYNTIFNPDGRYWFRSKEIEVPEDAGFIGYCFRPASIP